MSCSGSRHLVRPISTTGTAAGACPACDRTLPLESVGWPLFNHGRVPDHDAPEPPAPEPLDGYAGLTLAVREMLRDAELVDDGDTYGYLVSPAAIKQLRELVGPRLVACRSDE